MAVPYTARYRFPGTGASGRLLVGVSYTWSKSLDNSSNYRDIMPDTYYSNNLWGPSEYDAAHAAGVTIFTICRSSNRKRISLVNCLAVGD